MAQNIETASQHNQNPEKPLDLSEQAKTVQDLLDISHDFYINKGALEIYHQLKAANLLKSPTTFDQIFPAIEQALNLTNKTLEEAMAPTLREAIGKTQLPFPIRKKSQKPQA